MPTRRNWLRRKGWWCRYDVAFPGATIDLAGPAGAAWGCLGLLGATMGQVAASAERSDFVPSTLAAKTGPTEAYNRQKHYGKTPTAADRKAVGAGEGEFADHQPALVERYYEGDPSVGKPPGHTMTSEERKASAGDRSRMTPQPQG